MQEKTFFVNKEGFATIVCPSCGKAKPFDSSRLPPNKTRLKVNCKCGEVFGAKIEFRKQYRKQVSLEGSYENQSHAGDVGKVVVLDISMGGVGFRTERGHDIATGNILTLTFTLDTNPPRTVTRKVRVLRVSGKDVGCAYLQQLARDPDIGLYLMA